MNLLKSSSLHLVTTLCSKESTKPMSHVGQLNIYTGEEIINLITSKPENEMQGNRSALTLKLICSESLCTVVRMSP
ncbi:hypothetical protein RIF29_39932 [Crotalaria pallida]|uniref:Uncharacterized protein n=1 Tax=Crotalaria pallida TaxID=3830 RepID=A0AAN9E265_CROPI